MPLERVSNRFKDLSMSLQVNPLNNDIISIFNETAISRSIRNLVFTLSGERFFNQDVGCKVSRVLFENIDEISASIIKSEIVTTVVNYEPRVALTSVDVVPDYDSNAFEVTIRYNVIGIDASPQQLAFALQSTR